MNIQRRIIESQIDFEVRTGHTAKHCYIGRNELRELTEWVKEYATQDMIANHFKGQELNGLCIFMVDEDSHLYCA